MEEYIGSEAPTGDLTGPASLREAAVALKYLEHKHLNSSFAETHGLSSRGLKRCREHLQSFTMLEDNKRSITLFPAIYSIGEKDNMKHKFIKDEGEYEPSFKFEPLPWDEPLPGKDFKEVSEFEAGLSGEEIMSMQVCHQPISAPAQSVGHNILSSSLSLNLLQQYNSDEEDASQSDCSAQAHVIGETSSVQSTDETRQPTRPNKASLSSSSFRNTAGGEAPIIPAYLRTSVHRIPRSRATSSVMCDCTDFCQKIEDLKQFIRKSLEQRDDPLKQLRKEVVEMRKEVKLLKKYLRKSEGQSFTDASNLPALPLKTMEDLQKMENVLCTEEEMSCLVNKLSVIGGSQIRSVINNMMNHVIDRKVAVQFTLHGKTSKKAFKDLKIYPCILEACKRNPLCKDLHPSAITKFISLNLVYAKDRLQKKSVTNERASADPSSQVKEIEEKQHAKNM